MPAAASVGFKTGLSLNPVFDGRPPSFRPTVAFCAAIISPRRRSALILISAASTSSRLEKEKPGLGLLGILPTSIGAAVVPAGPEISYRACMEHCAFKIGLEFYTAAGTWRCTDIGTRVIIAIRVDSMTRQTISDGKKWTDELTSEQAEAEGWFNGPPYPVAETVFDEYDLEGCSLDPREWDDDEPAVEASR